MSEEKKESEIKTIPEDSVSTGNNKQETTGNTASEKTDVEKVSKAVAEAEAAARAAEEAEVAAIQALERAKELKSIAEKAAEAEYKAIAEEVKAESAKSQDYTFQRKSEEIFRRDMGEPEFWLDKKDRFTVPILSQEQQDELTRKAEIPVDNTPQYNPENILSPEYGGVSNYESGIGNFLEETRTKLAKLKKDPNATRKEIIDAEKNLAYLESLHENYYLGMNVFRTAKGGRRKINA